MSGFTISLPNVGLLLVKYGPKMVIFCCSPLEQITSDLGQNRQYPPKTGCIGSGLKGWIVSMGLENGGAVSKTNLKNYFTISKLTCADWG